ncbi:MAG: sensor histidine kinase, partial [Bacteroidales bacterium]|nr:sensor histidine kinase [Bacteroidales bacterium]
KEYQQGIKEGLTAKEILERDKNFGLGLNTYKFLALNYAALGNNELALKYHDRWEELSDSTFSEANARAISKLEVEYETEKKEKELLKERANNERLAKEKALAEIRVYNRNKWIIGISGLSLIIILSALALGQRKRRKIQAEKDAAIIAEREKGLKAVIDAQEEERQRIAKDLHDGVGQQVSAIKLHLQNIAKNVQHSTNNFNTEFQKISGMITDTGNEIRSISHRMMPRALTELGLISALEDMIDKSFTYSKISCTFEHHGLNERLPTNLEIGLYRIAQELINNIIKHSAAHKVDIQLMKTKTFVILIVQDDGVGMNQEQERGGIGMLNINNRLRTINGELNFESFSGEGTTATIRIAI